MRNTYRGVTEDTPSDVEDSVATKLPRSPHKIEERRLDPDNDEDDDAQVSGQGTAYRTTELINMFGRLMRLHSGPI